MIVRDKIIIIAKLFIYAKITECVKTFSNSFPYSWSSVLPSRYSSWLIKHRSSGYIAEVWFRINHTKFPQDRIKFVPSKFHFAHSGDWHTIGIRC